MAFNESLIAPCGMNCGICMAYLRTKNKCNGCRHLNEWNPKTRVNCKIKNCEYLEPKNRVFCYECEAYPCQRIKHMDVRYRAKYHMSVIENLEDIQNQGMSAFLEAQTEQWTCEVCGGTINVHKGVCSKCGKIK